MNWIAVPAVMMAAVSFYVGFYYLWTYARRRAEAENLAFALTCYSIAFYDIFCAGLYNSVSPLEGMFWQRLQFAVLTVFSITVSWFIYFFTRYKKKLPFIIITVWMSILLALGLVVQNELTLSLNRPMVKVVKIWGGLTIRYNEVDPGFIYSIQYISMIALCVFILHLVIQHYRHDDKRHAWPILFSFITFFFVALNDVMVGSAVYPFIYLMEYGYMFIILSMAYVLQNRFIDLHREVEELSMLLEDKVNERTMDLFFSEIARGLYLDMFSEASGKKGKDERKPVEVKENNKTSVNKLSKDISIISNIDELLDRSLVKAVEISGAARGFLFMINDRNRLDLKVSRSTGGHPSAKVWEIVEYVFRTRKTITTRDEAGDNESDGEDSISSGGKTIIAMPIILRDDIIGVCYLEKGTGEEGLNQKDERLVQAFIEQAASAIENAFLYQRMLNKGRDNRQPSVTANIEEKMKRAIAYIEENYHSDISREGLAASLNMHPDSFGRFFKIYTNKKINEFINELRVRDSAKKLTETDDNIIDIAFSVGFESLPTFNRAFLKVMRVTPTRYREENIKKNRKE